MTSLLSLGIALIPDSIGIEYLVKLNRAIQEVYPSSFILEDGQSLLPHISLFQGQFELNRLDTITKTIETTWGSLKTPLIIKSNGLNLWLNKIFFLDLEITERLKFLQNSIIDSIDPLRARNSGSADPQKLEGLNKKEKVSINHYSYPFAGPAFRPHFTMGRIEKPSNDQNLQAWIRKHPIPAEFKFERFVLFDVGMYGTLEKIRFQTQ